MNERDEKYNSLAWLPKKQQGPKDMKKLGNSSEASGEKR